MHLKQPGLIYSTCGPFNKIKKIIQKFKETGDSTYIYQNELEKACFQRDISHGDFQELTRRAVPDQIIIDKLSNIAKNPKYYQCPEGLASMVSNFFDKTVFGSSIKNANISAKNQQQNYTNQLLENLRKRQVYSSFRDKIQGC